nr:hypothetical protein [Chloroflexota bacterium]
PAHVFPRATDHIPEMLELAERLVDLGHAYASPAGNVYYAVATDPGYGRLSGNALDELRAGHRGFVDVDKRDPADFALWKAAGAGRSLKWASPRWGDGFPGWHLECSAMAKRYLGDRFDLHTGGIDNVFPHHEDEIAQSSPIVGGSPATMWIHGAFLLADGRKMAKSSGNFQRVTELAEHGLDPLAFRYLALTAAYAHTLESSDTSLAAAAVGLRSLRVRVAALGRPKRWVRGPLRRSWTQAPRAIDRRAKRFPVPWRGSAVGSSIRSAIEPTTQTLPSPRRAVDSTTGWWPRSTTTWTFPERWSSSARSFDPTCRSGNDGGSCSTRMPCSGWTCIAPGSGPRQRM